MPGFDIIIKDGMIFDGARNPRFKSDLGIKDGVITAMGHLRASDANRVIDAGGLHVAPGFIDLHTHYDAQIYWDPYCSMSSWHGSTSVVIGNCGFGFAPVAADARERAMLALSRNEAIPLRSMQEGMPWDWETFPQYLDSVDRTPKSINLLPYMGLSPLLIWTMGIERAKAGEMPTDAEHAEMRRILNEAMDAGACGWSVQTTGVESIQRDYDGTAMPTDVMHKETMLELARVLGERNEGFMQATLYTSDGPAADRLHFEQLAEVSRRPMIWNALAVMGSTPGHRDTMNWLKSCLERGLRIYPQAVTSDLALTFTLEDWNLWDSSPPWREATIGTTSEEKAVKFADADWRSAFKASDTTGSGGGAIEDTVLVRGFTEETRQYENLMIKDIATLTGKHPYDVVLDLALADNQKAVFYVDPLSFNSGARAYHKEILDFEYGLPGTSDGGAHTKFLTAARYTTEYLTTWVRDMAWLSLEEAHWRLSAYPAFAAGFRDRGVLREGAAADIVVYDYAKLGVLSQEVVYDMPGDEWRRVQRAKGYRYILVNGEVTIEDDKETGAASGQLLRYGVGRSTVTA
jgi:N-acyl-D-aspartate/D-glutamate deacylase